MATPVEIQYRVVGADQVAGALQQMENRARQMSSAMTGTMAPARAGIAALSSSLSHAASAMHLAGGATANLGQQLQTATIAIFAATTAIQALRGATLAWAGVIAIANAAMVSFASIAAAITAAVLAAPFAAAALVAGGLVTTLVLLKPELLGFKTAIAAVTAEVDLAVVRAASWVKAWSTLDTAFQLVRESAFGLRLELRGLLGVTDELAQRWRIGITKTTTEQEKESKRLAETVRREAEAHKKLADQLRETRMGRELDLIVQTNVAKRAMDLANAARQHAQFLRDSAIAEVEALRSRNEVFERATRIMQNLSGVQGELSEITSAFGPLVEGVANTFRVSFAEALDIVSGAQQLAEVHGLSFAEALNEIQKRAEQAGLSISAFVKHLKAIPERAPRAFAAEEFEIPSIAGLPDALRRAEAIALTFGTTLREAFLIGAEAMALATRRAISFGEALKIVMSEGWRRLKEFKDSIQQSFATLFTDILSGAKSFGDAILDFFRNVVNNIINLLAQIAAKWIILKLFGLSGGGIVAGGLTPLFAAQGGGIVSRPTLALMGEGGQDEMVLNRRQAREFIGLPEGQTARPREAVIHLTIHNVIGDPRALGIMTAGDVAGVIVNDVSRRGPTIQAIRVALA